jgi:hypothetical protein
VRSDYDEPSLEDDAVPSRDVPASAGHLEIIAACSVEQVSPGTVKTGVPSEHVTVGCADSRRQRQ